MTLSLAWVVVAGCSDDPKTQDVDATSDAHNTSDVGDSNDGTDAVDDDASGDIGEDVSRAAPTLVTGAVTPTSLCAGTEMTIPFALSGGDGETYYVRAQLSDRNGDFGDATVLGGVSTATDGVITAAVPAGMRAGTGYRVRVLTDDGVEVVAADSGQDLEILAAGEPELVVAPRAVLVGDSVRFIDETEGIVSRTWTFPSDADIASSTAVAADVSFSSPGIKTVTYEGVTADGCLVAATLDSPFDSVEVISCEPSVPAEARIYDASNARADEFGGLYTGWLCGAGSLKAAGGQVSIFVEPGATFEFSGGGGYTVYVKRGGTFVGGSGGQATLVVEPGANIVKAHSNEVRIECPSLEFDYTDSPETGCLPTGTDPDAVTATAGDFGAGPHCPGATITVPVALDGAVGPTNHVIAQISDKNGDFTKARNLEAAPATASGDVDFVLPTDIAAGAGYRLRLMTSHPPSVGPESAPFSVPEAAQARIQRNGTKSLIGSAVTFTNTSDAHIAARWDFGPEASPATSESTNGTTTFNTKGWKTVTLTITDAVGCTASATVERDPDVYDSGFEVLACAVPVPADAVVLAPGPHEQVGGNKTLWICGGATAEVFGGLTSAVVEEDGILNFTGGGEHTFYARAGAIVGGGNGGLSTLVFETGAFVANGDRFTNLLECPSLAVDIATAPSPGCQPFVPPAHTLSFDGVENTLVCLDDRFDATFSTEGIYRLDNTFRLLASDAAGSFASPIELGSTNDAAGGRVVGRFRPRDFAPGTGYRLRLTSAIPALTADFAGVMTLEVPPDITVSAAPFVEPGQPIVVTNTTSGTPSFVWSLDDEVLSTERNPTFSFTTFGTRYIDVTATTDAGCQDDTSVSVKVVSCTPPIEARATVVTGTRPESFGGSQRLWICDGGVASAGAGDYDVYIEDGGTFTFTGGGLYSIYVKSGGTYNGELGGRVAVYAEAGAILNLAGDEEVVKTCAPLTFDTTLAPGSGCQ